MHLALWCLAGVSVLGAAVSFARPKHVAVVAEPALSSAAAKEAVTA
jgi:hypothetical protein